MSEEKIIVVDDPQLDSDFNPSQETILKWWEERMAKRKAKEDAIKKEEAENLRQEYLRSTGRKELKP